MTMQPPAEPFSELPSAWGALFDGRRLTEKQADAAILTTIDSEGWAHICFIGAGEVLADQGRVYMALWPGSCTASNLRSGGRASLVAVLDGAVWEAHMEVRFREQAAAAGALTVFEATIVGVRRHPVPYAQVERLVGFTLNDPERVIARWSEQIDMLRRVATDRGRR
jgi:hypothetical protein